MLLNDWQFHASWRTLEETHAPGSTVLVRRMVAMGDLLMLRAAVVAFNRRVPMRWILRTTGAYARLFRDDPLWDRVVAVHEPSPVGCDRYWVMDGIAEMDHATSAAPRTPAELFLRDMTKAKIGITKDDWMMPIPVSSMNAVDQWCQVHRAGRDRPMIALQVRGSGPMKTLPRPTLVRIAERIVESGRDVVLIDPEPKSAWKADGVFSMPGQDVITVIELIRRCEACVCMYSGALPMAMSAGCPVVLILGPINPSLPPEYVPVPWRMIKLNDWIQCPPCNERPARCSNRWSCLRDAPADRVADQVLLEIESLGAGDIALPVAAS